VEKVYFETINGKQIFTIFSEPQTSQKKIVIMSHGFRGSTVGPARQFVDFSRLLVKNEFSVLRFDQPNSGNSEGEYLDSSFNEWVNTTTYFAKQFLDKGYQIALIGQSMGATTSVIASAKKELQRKVSCLLLWVPDPKSTFDKSADEIFEEGGQKYKGMFWKEAKKANFFECLDRYKGGIHLVYGEKDRFIKNNLMKKVIDKVRQKGQAAIVLPNQDHSPWEFDVVQAVYQQQLKKLQECLGN